MHTLLLLVLLAAPAPAPAAPAGPGDLPPAAWAPADTTDALYREARRLLNGGEMARAAALFNQIHSRHPRSEYAADAYYWEAFARHRLGGESNLRQALGLLDAQGRIHPGARTRSDAGALETRIRGSLAEAGDREASARLARAAGGGQARCEDADLRAAALVALARSEPQQAGELARSVLRRRDACSTVLREHAVHLLARQGTAASADLLMEVVRTDPAPSVQEAALHALARSGGSPEALIRLYGQLQSPRHRETILHAVQREGSPESRAFLRGRLLDSAEAPAIREAALHALARGSTPRELVELYGRLTVPSLREATLYQVARIDDPAAHAFLRERVMDRAETPALREAALYGLARAPRGEAVPLLIEIARTEPTRRLREAAVHALARSDDPRARQFLRELVAGP